MLYCPWVLVAMEAHFPLFTLKYQYFENFFEGTLLKKEFAKTFPQYMLGSLTLCDSPVMLPSNRQLSDILTEHFVGKL